MDLALNNLQRLICHKTKQNKQDMPDDVREVKMNSWMTFIENASVLADQQKLTFVNSLLTLDAI